jgi:putative toxin-antitoxin system antitoxin component (TIGR02293 family)
VATKKHPARAGAQPRRGKGPLRRGAKARSARAADRPAAGAGPATDAWWGRVVDGQLSIGSLHRADPMERVELARAGVPAAALGVIARDMGIARDKLYATIGVPRATMERKVREQRRLSPDESERVLGVARLVAQVEQMVGGAGTGAGPAFGAARWVAAWLDTPLPALGGERPASLMDTAAGREIVAGLVAQLQSGAYA